MTRQVPIGQVVTDQFPVFDFDGYSKVTGETVFTPTLWNDAVVSGQSVTITEIGSTGEYEINWTPNAGGFWKLEILVDYSKDTFGWEYEAIIGEFGASMADNGTTAEFAVWMQFDGERRTDVDSMAALIRDAQDNTIVDLGTDSSDTTDGVFRFTTASSNLTAHTSYLLHLTATIGTATQDGNVGFVRAG